MNRMTRITYHDTISFQRGCVEWRSLKDCGRVGAIGITVVALIKRREVWGREVGFDGGRWGHRAVGGSIEGGRRLPRRHLTVGLGFVRLGLLGLVGAEARSGTPTQLFEERHDLLTGSAVIDDVVEREATVVMGGSQARLSVYKPSSIRKLRSISSSGLLYSTLSLQTPTVPRI